MERRKVRPVHFDDTFGSRGRNSTEAKNRVLERDEGRHNTVAVYPFENESLVRGRSAGTDSMASKGAAVRRLSIICTIRTSHLYWTSNQRTILSGDSEMAKKEGRQDTPSPSEKKPTKGSFRSRFKQSWFGENWSTLVILIAIFMVALFVWSFFAYSTTVNSNFSPSGGSDPYYHMHVINYIEATGSHLVNDPNLNYPLGVRNERAPLYDWSVAITSMFITAITGGAISLTTSTGFVEIFSTVFWGIMVMIPTYLIARQAFGNRAALIAAFLLSIMSGYISRTVLGSGEYDVFILFFTVFTLYFLMMSLKNIKGKNWVASWKKPGEIRSGLRSFLSQNQKSLIYAMLGGFCLAMVGMSWTGYPYVMVIILVYLLVQILINRFRGIDSLGISMSVGALLLIAFAVMAPLYWQLSYWEEWYNVPFYLFAGAMVFAGIFVVTRDYPWTLVIPTVGILTALGLIALSIFDNSIFQAIISGQGYFVKNSLYSTIAEAQAPTFSAIAYAFGPVTFFLAIAGLVWAAVKIPKNDNPFYLFVVVWMLVTAYMGASAVRFLFDAAPVFAIAAGWILSLIIGMVHFEDVPKLMSGFWTNKRAVLRRTFKLRYVAAVLFLAFLVILPNTIGALDAAIPSNDAKTYDNQIYYALPDLLHPSSSYFNVNNNTLWYLTGSYEIPVPSDYYEAAWKWFAERDANMSENEKPAYLSWWDYGFSAEQEGLHPTVADDFQNGYQIAASFMLAQNETAAISLLVARLLDATGVTDANEALFLNNNMTQAQVDQLKDILANPNKDVTLVENNPDIYGQYAPNMDPQNAKYAAERVLLSSIGEDNLVNLYHDLRQESGYNIGYFAIDSRLFPLSASDSDIFYAPALLGSTPVDSNNNPTNFYTIYAVDNDGNYIALNNVTSSETIVGYQIVYTDAFYNTMLYRAFMGLSPSDVGATEQGLPGLAGSLANYAGSYQGYMLQHFVMVYKTAYYNPYNATEVANHTDAWTAISYDEALELQAQINAGKLNGTIDDSADTLENGVVFLQYYDGAIIQGRATSPDGSPLAGVYVTVLDQYGIPHDVVQTNATGYYSVIAPFGNVSVVYSTGTLNTPSQIASTKLAAENYTISYAQAMRETNNYTFDGNISLPVTTVEGNVFWDENGNGRYESNDEYIQGANVSLSNTTTGFSENVTTGSDGSYSLVGPSGSIATLTVTYEGHVVSNQTVTLTPDTTVQRNVAVAPATISGVVTLSSGGDASGVSLTLTDQTSGTNQTTTTSSTGGYSFSKLLAGRYTITPTDQNLTAMAQSVNVTAGKTFTSDLTIYSASQVSGTLDVSGSPQSNVTIGFQSGTDEVFATTNSSGGYSTVLPQGNYTAYSIITNGNANYVVFANLTATSALETLDLTGYPAVVTSGTVTNNGSAVGGASIVIVGSNGARLRSTANSTGYYRIELPAGTYFIYAEGSDRAFWSNESLSSNGTFNIPLNDAQTLSGTITYSTEYVPNALITVTDINNPAQSVTVVSGTSGSYQISLPTGGGYSISVMKDGFDTEGSTINPLTSPQTANFNLVPLNRTVSGTVTNGGSGLSGVTVKFVNAGSQGGNLTTSTGTNGAFSLSLPPGSYYVVVDQDVVAGSNMSMYQSNESLIVQVGEDPAPLSINVTERVLVNGTVALDGAAGTITFSGPENKIIDAATGFPVYLEPGSYNVYTLVSKGSAY